MQASRVCSVTLTPETTTISNPVPAVYKVSSFGSTTPRENKKINDITTKIEGETKPMREKEIPDPIRMFGFTTPRELKAAQSESVSTIEDILPQLASVDSQMKALEIAIRRARKYRAKAEAHMSDDIPA